MRRTLSALVVVTLAAATPLPARAGNPDLDEGIRLVSEMEDQRALAALERALARPGNTARVKAQIQLYMGLAHGNLLDNEKARSAFRAALRDDPEVRPPAGTSPKLKALFDEVRAELAARSRPVEPRPPPVAPPGAPSPAPATSRPTSPVRVAAWVALGATIAAGGAAIACGVLARSSTERSEDLKLPYGEAAEHHDEAERRALAANVLYGVTGAAAVTAGVLFYLGWLRPERAQASIAPLPSGLMAQVRLAAW